MSKAMKHRELHGYTKTPTYRTWDKMIQRCSNPKNEEFRNYGGRGIQICERWRLSFKAFLEDMGARPEGMSIDRYPDKNGNYEPSNCRWATPTEQCNNTRVNRTITHDGRTGTYVEWARWQGWPLHTVGNRIGVGWDEVRAITEPPARYKPRAAK